MTISLMVPDKDVQFKRKRDGARRTPTGEQYYTGLLLNRTVAAAMLRPAP
jgi:hypothetical protein